MSSKRCLATSADIVLFVGTGCPKFESRSTSSCTAVLNKSAEIEKKELVNGCCDLERLRESDLLAFQEFDLSESEARNEVSMIS